MADNIVSILIVIVSAYLIAGLLFVIPFQLTGLQKIDAGAHGSSIGFRVIIIPGCVLLWPVLLRKWVKAAEKINSQH